MLLGSDALISIKGFRCGTVIGTAMENKGAMRLFYATRDGQSRRIAVRIADRLAERGIGATPQDLAQALPAAGDLAKASLIVVVAAVRYGRHLPEADRFLAGYRNLASPAPLILASVNLTARKPAKSTAETNPYLRKLIVRHQLAPVLATAVAGRLDYRRYRWLDRQIIRFIMMLTSGPTDPDTCIEYTSWPAVDEFASRIADIFLDDPASSRAVSPAGRLGPDSAFAGIGVGI
jgi:menaquinone-dependent protoporphyrinogen oxidase